MLCVHLEHVMSASASLIPLMSAFLKGWPVHRTSRRHLAHVAARMQGTTKIERLPKYLPVQMMRFYYKVDVRQKAKILRKASAAAHRRACSHCNVQPVVCQQELRWCVFVCARLISRGALPHCGKPRRHDAVQGG